MDKSEVFLPIVALTSVGLLMASMILYEGHRRSVLLAHRQRECTKMFGPYDMSRAQEIFDKADTNHNGAIDPIEAQEVQRNLHFYKRLISAQDYDKNSTTSYALHTDLTRYLYNIAGIDGGR